MRLRWGRVSAPRLPKGITTFILIFFPEETCFSAPFTEGDYDILINDLVAVFPRFSAPFTEGDYDKINARRRRSSRFQRPVYRRGLRPNPLNLSLNLLIYRHDYDVAWGALDVVWRHRV